MNQAFANHRIVRAGSASIDACLDVMSDYFAYMAVVSVAAAAIAVSPGFLDNATVGFPDHIVKPAVETQSLAEPIPANKPAGAWRTSTKVAR